MRTDLLYPPKKRHIFLKLMLAVCFFMAGLTGTNQLKAQPTNYCTPYPNTSFQYSYCWSNQYGYIANVRIFNSTTGMDALNNASGDNVCYKFFPEPEGNLQLGNSFTIRVTGFNPYQYGGSMYTRAFIDWNADGDFNDAGEYLGTVYKSLPYGTTGTYDVDFSFSVPCSTPRGKTRIRVTTSQWYDQGSNACVNGYAYAPSYNYGYGETEDYVVNFDQDLKATYPDLFNILFTNEAYDGTDRMKNGSLTTFARPSVSTYAPQGAGSLLNYKIIGPLPSTNVVYEGLDPVTGSKDISMTGLSNCPIMKARGPFAQSDGSFKANMGGEYRVSVKIFGTGCQAQAVKVFTVAWPNDLSIRDIASPLSNVEPRYFKYPRGNAIRVAGTFQNTGENDVTKFTAIANIIGTNGRDTVYSRDITYDAAEGKAPIAPGQKITLDFPQFLTDSALGVFKIYMTCDLLSAVDQEAYNNDFARSGDAAYTFETANEVQLQANLIQVPAQGQQIYGNRPIIPLAEIKNVGVFDASDVPAKMTIYKMPDRTVVYQSNIVIQDVPMGRYNTKSEFFDPVVLSESGNYRACLVVSEPNDPIRSDDSICVDFSVIGGLAGTYTVGTQNSGSARNYATIDAAMDDLYMKGLAGPVTFELTDATYTVTSKRLDYPAWDFSSYIINSGYDAKTGTVNTITWKPTATRGVTRAGVTINLESANGKGIVFGQNIEPTNKYAVYKEFWNKPALARKFANSNGYIIFDGGAMKGLKIVLKSNSKAHASAFYLGRGTENVTIKNVIVENGTGSLSQNVWLPMTSFTPSDGFYFQDDTLRGAGNTISSYSAGIVNRSRLIRMQNAVDMKLDTIANNNNTIQGNEISGFGYGILSLGIGELLMEKTTEYKRFYNYNNNITGNLIHNAYRAGIYLGYEENSNVDGNKIYGIGGTGISSAGIIAGGDGKGDLKGYNNIGLNISGNEVNGVTSDISSTGIRVEQQRNSFPHTTKGQVTFPDREENMKLTNNAIWGIATTDASANRIGIHMLTERKGNDYTKPMYADYSMRNDKIINNTVIVTGDNGLANKGIVAGIALQQSTGATLYNNAIAFLDNESDATSPAFAAVFYEGLMPKDGGVSSDRNVFWIPAASQAAVYRFIETDANNEIIDLSSKDDYKTLHQWQNWTGNDKNSVTSDFYSNDLTYTGSEPNQKLRIKGTPTGSVLNNRGQRFEWLTTDIDGNARGTAGQNYDIGASEFAGNMRVTDVEVLSVSAPAAYRSGSDTFSDAEYIMTVSPVEVKGLFRNNGSIQTSGVNATVRIYRETITGTFPAAPILERSTKINLTSGETIEAGFNLASGLSTDFRPETYTDLASQGYEVPAVFAIMKSNVTPRYKIEVSLESDQNNDNNTDSKIVRFYLQRSGLKFIVSAENTMKVLDTNSSANDIAGRLNYDSLMSGLNRIGWMSNPDLKRNDFDIFDRMSWEPKAVSYTNYRTLLWSDGSDRAMTRFERNDIRNFFTNSSQSTKKNLLIGSQEMVRSNEPVDKSFVNNVLSAVNVQPGNPLGSKVTNDGNIIVGVAAGLGLPDKILDTRYPGDEPPYTGLVGLYSDVDALVLPAYYYKNHTASRSDSIAGVATSSMINNVIYAAVDWRHFGNITTILREMFDFAGKNGGTIIPIELTDFSATARDKRIEVSWATATELNSDRFEVERAEKVNGTNGMFETIATEKAAGKSVAPKHYGPVVDRNVEMNRTYVYRLRMFDKDGSSKLSNEAVASLSGSDVLWMAEVTPNPAETMANISYSVPQSGDVELALYDMAGRKVMTVASGSTEAGSHEISLNVSGLANGVYTIMLSSGNDKVTRKVRVVR